MSDARKTWLVTVALLLGAFGGGFHYVRERGLLLAPHLRAVQPLVRAVGARRLFEPRLSGGFGHAEWTRQAPAAYATGPKPAVIRRSTTRTDDSGILAAAALVKAQAENRPVPENRAALAAAHLLLGEADEAVRILQGLLSDDPKAADIRSNLAAAYLVRADATGHASDLAKALDSATLALEDAPDSPEATFNRALALTRLRLFRGSLKAWQRAIEVEQDPSWRNEAQQQLSLVQESALSTKAPSPDLEESLDRADRAQVVLTVRADYAAARTHFETDGLRRLRRDPTRAHLLAEVFAAEQGDTDFRDILTSSSVDQAETCGAFLSAAHDAYNEARWSDLETPPEDVGPKDSPCRLWGRYYQSLGRYVRSVDSSIGDLFSLAASAERRGYLTLAARTLTLHALTLQASGNLGSAIAAFESSRELYRKVGFLENVGYVSTLLAEALNAEGDTARSWDERMPGLASAHLLTDDARRFSTHYSLARFATQGGHARVALDALSEVESLARSGHGGTASSPLYWSVGRAQAIEAISPGSGLSELVDADRYLDEMTDPVARKRNQIELAVVRGELAATADREPFASRELLLDRAIEALDSRGASNRLPGLLSLRARLLEGNGQLVEAKRDYSAALESARHLKPQIESMASLQESLAAAAAGFVRTCACSPEASLSSLHTFFDSVPPTDGDGRAHLRPQPGHAALVFLFAADSLSAWTIKDTGTELTTTSLPSNLRSWIQSALGALAADDLSGLQSAGGRLYDLILRPLEPTLAGVRRVAMVTHGSYLNIPFRALFDTRTGRFSGESMVISQAAAIGSAVRPHEPAQRARVLSVADPANDLTPLPGARREALEISKLYASGLVLVGADAEPRRVELEASQADVVHFAIHADFRISRRGGVSMALTERVPLRQISSWRFGPRPVIVLAACDSARSSDERGGEGRSLILPFLTAGAFAVVGSLRPLADDSGADLFVRLHRGIIETGDPALVVHSLSNLQNQTSRDLTHLSLAVYQPVQ